MKYVAYPLRVESETSDGSPDTLVPQIGVTYHKMNSVEGLASLYQEGEWERAKELDWCVTSTGMPSCPDVYKSEQRYYAVCKLS